MTDQQVNGPSGDGKYIDTIDPEDPEYIREMRRPAEVKEDVKQMEARKRVSHVMRSQAFREELEQMVHEQLRQGPHPASLLALQQISELMLPQFRFNQTTGFTKHISSSGTAIPIADIRGVDSLNYTKGEKIMRCKLAACYRLIDLYGWSHGINSHITARISQEHEHFLVNPYGMMYHEVTASSLVKVDMQGEVVDPGTSTLGINKNGFSLHSAIHAARPDVKSIIHLYTPSAVAISSLKCGLLPLCREAMILGEMSEFEFTGALVDQEERDGLARALGPRNKVLVLRGQGIVACGESIEEAFHMAFNVMTACDAQLKAMPLGIDNILLPSEEVQRKTFEQANQPAGTSETGEGRKKWRRGEMEFEALMRHLDNAGFRTGYIYHEPLVRRDPRKDRANSDVEVPPVTSSFAAYWDEESLANSPLKQHLEKQKKQYRTDWLATPNSYKKEEFDEVGTPNPKKITKWVAEEEDSPNRQVPTPVKIENPNQFAPQGSNPKELRQKHKEIRKDYYEEKISSGPQSRILEGMSWEEAQKIKDGHVSGTTDSMIVVGAASKGIIQRDHQHNAVVYKQYYAPNPFDSMTEEEIEKYKDEVQHGGQPGQPEGELEPGPDGRLISSEERMAQVRAQEAQVAQQVVKKVDRGSKETNLDEVFNGHGGPAAVTPVTRHSAPPRSSRGSSRGTSQGDPPSPTTPPPQDFKRTSSARYPHGEQAQETAINGEQAGSPTKSTSSGDGTMEEGNSSSAPAGSPTKEGKKKKKFRIPSFSKKKDKEKNK